MRGCNLPKTNCFAYLNMGRPRCTALSHYGATDMSPLLCEMRKCPFFKTEQRLTAEQRRCDEHLFKKRKKECPDYFDTAEEMRKNMRGAAKIPTVRQREEITRQFPRAQIDRLSVVSCNDDVLRVVDRTTGELYQLFYGDEA